MRFLRECYILFQQKRCRRCGEPEHWTVFQIIRREKRERAGSDLIFKFTAAFYAMMIKSIFISDKTRRNCLYPSILNMAPGILNAGCPMQIAVI